MGAGGGTDIIFRQIVEKVNKSGAKPQLQVVNVGGQGEIKAPSKWQKQSQMVVLYFQFIKVQLLSISLDV